MEHFSQVHCVIALDDTAYNKFTHQRIDTVGSMTAMTSNPQQVLLQQIFLI